MMLRVSSVVLHSAKRALCCPFLYQDGPVWSYIMLTGSHVVPHCAMVALCGPKCVPLSPCNMLSYIVP